MLLQLLPINVSATCQAVCGPPPPYSSEEHSCSVDFLPETAAVSSSAATAENATILYSLLPHRDSQQQLSSSCARDLAHCNSNTLALRATRLMDGARTTDCRGASASSTRDSHYRTIAHFKQSTRKEDSNTRTATITSSQPLNSSVTFSARVTSPSVLTLSPIRSNTIIATVTKNSVSQAPASRLEGRRQNRELQQEDFTSSNDINHERKNLILKNQQGPRKNGKVSHPVSKAHRKDQLRAMKHSANNTDDKVAAAPLLLSSTSHDDTLTTPRSGRAQTTSAQASGHRARLPRDTGAHRKTSVDVDDVNNPTRGQGNSVRVNTATVHTSFRRSTKPVRRTPSQPAHTSSTVLTNYTLRPLSQASSSSSSCLAPSSDSLSSCSSSSSSS